MSDFPPQPKTVDFLAQEAMNAIRRHDMNMSLRGIWLSCLILIAQYPADFPDGRGRFTSEPIPLGRLCKLLGSQRVTVERALAELDELGLIRYDDNGRLWHKRPDVVEITGG